MRRYVPASTFRRSRTNESLGRVAVLVGLAVVYYSAAKLGLRFAYINSSVTTVWPPAGIALAAFVLLGYRVWPAILGAALLANLTTTGAIPPSIGIASLALGGLVSSQDAPRVWLTWWLGDAVGDMVVAPALILWIGVKPGPSWSRPQLTEAMALTLVTVVAALATFGGVFPSRHYPLTVVLWPIMIWVAFRFGPREAATTMLIVSFIAIYRTLHGVGPFSIYTTNESLVLLQVWTGVTAVTSLVLAAAVAVQRDIQGTWRALAVTDPLTGLANHRQLIQALETEILRSRRSAQPLAVVLLDLDGLKQINDRHGHLAGSLAIRRVAEALLGSCRATDTAARFGGDEFALVLPETGEAAAWHVARGVADRLATDAEKPNLSISVGVAVYPGQGETVEALLNAADVALYETKERRKSRAVGLAP